MAQQMTAS
jgi:hypothetical protein